MTYYRFLLFSLLPVVTSSTAEVCECDTVEAPRAENIYAIDSRLKDVREPSYGPVTCVPDAKIVNYLLRPAAYNKHKLPYKTGVKVKVEFWIQEITAISEMTNDFEMEMYINELWSDPKLKFDHLNACKANLSLDQATLARVWTPNSCFVNSKTAEIHDSPFTNVFLTLFENGTVWVNYNIYAIDSRLKDVREPSYGPVTCVPDAKIVNYLLRPAAYNKHKLPYKTGVKVKVEFWIQEITAISEMTNDFEMEMYINELWSDPKLKFDHLNACKANLSLDQATLVRWRVRVKGPCSMNLVDFPVDTQSCRLKYQSFSYNNEVRMRWNARRKPVFALKPLQITDFTLKEITPAVIRRNYPAGMWDELVVTFVFERRYMWYFLQAYLPTYFTIFISWLAFALGPQAITPRTMIGVNALLSMIFHFGSIMRNLPRVSYIKAIDVWMLSSMTFVFLSLVELAIVGLKERRKDNRPTIQRIDNVAQLVFPAAFSIFNIAYWARYGMKLG
ncbi:hypothetical protein Y032_0018g3684 [Ancylostoma ceylanicum]|uniref:Neurotransmitter-gated ion-channel ligand binding domain protein n=1 Tax=Ancylostoma ceylanicum TaxID=53326 RepID=A0A016V3R2_9BILA|nr:hypothetical protein Y032_0018g3684 [Ancylostoma ceylanicum]